MTRLSMHLPRARYVVGSLTLSVMTVGMINLAAAAGALPSQDQALSQALENHPEIVAAKAKVALAEAELYGKRVEVSRQVLTLYGSLKTLDAELAEAKANWGQLERTNLPKGDGQADQAAREKIASATQTAQRKLVVATGQREQAEKELRLLIGAMPGAKEAKTPPVAVVTAQQAPQGPIVDSWKVKAEQPIAFSFTDQPLTEVLNFLSNDSGIQFSVQGAAIEAEGMRVDMPISLSTSKVPLTAALQGFEDAYPGLQFVLRDYGVLLTTKDYAQEHGYMPVLEMSKAPVEGKAR